MTEQDPVLPLLSARDVARILGVTVRQVARLRTFGKVPPPLFVGRFPRWDRATIHQWIENGCPAQQPAAKS
jgi:predicted DNA-binding transcriptional regulator AlpA